MKVTKTNVLLACVVSLIVSSVFFFDGLDLNYFHAKWKNGSEFGGDLSEASLQENFYFFEKDVSIGKYIVFHRDMPDTPVVLDKTKFVDPYMLLKNEAVEVYATIDECRIFRDAKNQNAFLVEHKNGIISYVNTEQEAVDWTLICGMVVFKQ